MATESKLIKIDQQVLLEWVFDDNNFKQEDYCVMYNINSGSRSYVSKTGLNTIDNTLFTVDKTIRKYAQSDTAKYNFLKLENYAGTLAKFDTIRLHMPTNFSFYDNEYKGLSIRIYTYDYTNTRQLDISGYYYDDTLSSSQSQITMNQEFMFAGNLWGKYITMDIPSVDYISKQRTTGTIPDFPLPDTINQNLLPGYGVSTTSPIFIEFSFISTKTTTLGTTTFKLSSSLSSSINKSPDYQDVAANIQESPDWDYFEIYGSYDNSNEEFDNYINSLIQMGRSIHVEYIISKFEENVLMSTQTIVKTDNFSQKLEYRPVITTSNTTALLSLEMRIVDNTDSSYVSRYASVGLTNNIFKYGKKLLSVNMSNAYKPKIYNLKTSGSQNMGALVQSNLQDINLTKVNYPVITDRTKILMSSTSSNTTDYKPFGLAEIIINPFDNFIKFVMGEDPDNDGTITPYDLSKISENSSMFLVFKSDQSAIEKGIFQETDQNDYKNGVIVFKVDEGDVQTLKTISQSNTDFHIIVKSNLNGTKSLLYSGKFITFDKVKFLDAGGSYSAQNPNANMGDFFDNVGSTTPTNATGSTSIGSGASNSNMNALVFLNLDADVPQFESYLQRINANIYVKRAGGNEVSGAYVYFLLNITKVVGEDIKKQHGVKEVVFLPFDLGKNTGNNSGANITDTANAINGFNCDVAARATTG